MSRTGEGLTKARAVLGTGGDNWHLGLFGDVERGRDIRNRRSSDWEAGVEFTWRF